jgi:hypothetical protein
MTALATENFREQLLSRRYEPSVAAVNELCDTLQSAKTGTNVPYVDPMHDVDECRIISLYSNIGTADPSGFITAGDDEAATRMLGVQWKLGLRPLLKFLALVPRASVIVAHGTEANRLANLLLKTEVPMIWRRGLKTYKVRSLSGRAFAGTPARQEQYLEEMHTAYADAMARTGLTKPS